MKSHEKECIWNGDKMEIRLLTENEIQSAINVAHEVYKACVLPYAKSEEEVAQYNEYVNIENLWKEMQAGKLFLWGVFEEQTLCGVSAIQNAGHITMLYVRPMCQHRGYGAALLEQMRGYAKEMLKTEHVTINVIPVTAAPFFYKRGFQLFSNQVMTGAYVSLIADSKENLELRPKRKIPFGLICGIIGGFVTLIFVVALGYAIYHVAFEDRYVETEPGMEEFWENELGLPGDTEADSTSTETESISTDADYLADWNIEDPNQAETLPDSLGVAFLFPESELYIGENLSYSLQLVNFTYSDVVDGATRDFNVNYPQLVFTDGRDASAINNKIKESACYYLDTMYPEISTDYLSPESSGYPYFKTYVDYEVTYMDDDLICIAMKNDYSTGQSLVELGDVYSLVFNIQTGELYHVEDVIAHDAAFDQAYYDKLCGRNDSFLDAKGITTELVSGTLNGEVVDNRYFSNYSLCKDGMKLNFVYHYKDESVMMYGWVDVNYTTEELAAYHTESDFWNLFQEK